MKTLLALFISLLLLNWGLIPERNTMNTCVDISQQVAQELARPELVADYNGEDFTPTPTFLRIINAAHKHLDRRYSHENRGYVDRVSLPQGQWWLDAPAGLKYITRIDLEDADGNIVPGGGLGRRTLSYLRDRYGQRFDLVPEGQPQEWARNTYGVDVQASAGDEQITNGGFNLSEGQLNGWQASGSVPITGGHCLLQDSSIYQWFDEAKEFNGFTLTFDVYAISGSYNYVTLTNASLNSIWSAAITGTGTFSMVISGVPSAAQTIQFESAGGSTLEFDNVSIREITEAVVHKDIITMPPSDQDYTAVIYHTAYASPMVENSDISWWSDKHPDILVLAIKRQVELELNRNSTGVKDYDGVLELALFDVETDAGMESQAGPTEAFRFGWHP